MLMICALSRGDSISSFSGEVSSRSSDTSLRRMSAAGGQPAELPPNRQFQRFVEFGFLALGKGKRGETAQQPSQLGLLAARRVQPIAVGHVGLDEAVFIEQRQEPRPSVGQARAVDFRIPGNAHVARMGERQPGGDLVGEGVDDLDAGNAGDGFVVEGRHVGAGGAQFLDPRVDARKQFFRQPHHPWPLRKGAQKQQRVMEADERWSVPEAQFAGGGDELVCARCLRGTEAALAFLEADEDTVCIGRWHEFQDWAGSLP
jgi:hypothetical protein